MLYLKNYLSYMRTRFTYSDIYDWLPLLIPVLLSVTLLILVTIVRPTRYVKSNAALILSEPCLIDNETKLQNSIFAGTSVTCGILNKRTIPSLAVRSTVNNNKINVHLLDKGDTSATLSDSLFDNKYSYLLFKINKASTFKCKDYYSVVIVTKDSLEVTNHPIVSCGSFPKMSLDKDKLHIVIPDTKALNFFIIEEYSIKAKTWTTY